jgi:dTDP-4-amino-4,6-dideoxygalactose transaminase
MQEAATGKTLKVPFNRPYVTGGELGYIQQAIDNHQLSGNGEFSRACSSRMRDELGAEEVLITHSCTGALEMAALLSEIGPGDEIIMPSFTFSSTATAFVLRGATPVFVDVREDTLNLDERLVERSITARTRAVVAVHYAGVACEIDVLGRIARGHGIGLIEDAAQAFDATYGGRPLATFGVMGAISFHETKNVISGEGGALVINDPALVERAEVLLEKGTNRRAFHRGQIDKYTWVDVGSSFVASEMTAAFLWAQLERARWITAQRLKVWDRYHAAFAELERNGVLRRPIVPEMAAHNAHMYYLVMPSEARRDAVIDRLATDGVTAVFHYVPLHSSPAGRRLGRADGDLPVTNHVSGALLRLPLWVGMSDEQIEHVIRSVSRAVD